MNDSPILDCSIAPFSFQTSYLTPFPTERLIAKLRQLARKGLTCNITYDTNVIVNDMDATAQKLMQRLQELQEQTNRIARERQSLLLALEIAGVKPKGEGGRMTGTQEAQYEVNQSFRGRSLPASCEMILRDHKGQWLSKSEIEYLVIQGGYQFSTGNSKNSVGVTLQRMADDKIIEVQRVRGQQGNRYRWPLPSEEVKKK